MKSKNLLLVLALTVLSATAAFAQFSVGAEVGLPMGTFGDVAGIGIGGSLRYDKAINDNMSWGVSAGYLSFGGKELFPGISTGSSSLIPITGGIKYNFAGADGGFYGGVDLGIWMTSVSVSIPGFGSVTATGSEFGFAPGLGYRAGAFDVAARFNIVSSANYVGARIAYVFGAK